MARVAQSAHRRPRSERVDLDVRKIEDWFIEKGVPQFMVDYLPRDNMRVLLFLILIVVAFDLAVQPWVGINAWSLVIAPAALVCFTLVLKVTIIDQASQAYAVLNVSISGALREMWWEVHGWRRVWREVWVWRTVWQEIWTWRKARKEILSRSAVLFAGVYLLSCLIFSLQRSVYWSDSSVDFVVAVGLLWISASLFRTRPLMADYEKRKKRSLQILVLCAVVYFALEGSLLPSSGVLMDSVVGSVMPVAVPVPQGLVALAVTVIIFFQSRDLVRDQSTEGELTTQEFDLFFPSVPLLVLVLCAETTVLPYVGPVWLGAILPLVVMAVIVPLHILLRWYRELFGPRRIKWPRRFDVLLRYPGLILFMLVYLIAYPTMVGVLSASEENQFSIHAFGMPAAGQSAFILALGINLFYLIVAGVIAAFGLDRVAVWASKETWANWRERISNLGRALPILLVVTTFVLLTAELWETMAKISTVKYMALLGSILAITGIFHLLTSVKHLSARSEFESWADVIKAARAERQAYWIANIPPDLEIERLMLRLKTLKLEGEPRLPLGKLEKINALVVMMTYEILFFFPVMFLAIVVFFAIGYFVVPPEVAATWVYGDGTPASRGEGLAHLPPIDQPWLRVAVLLAAFSVLSLAVDVLSDSDRRIRFFDSADRAIRRRLAVRLAYHKVLGEQ